MKITKKQDKLIIKNNGIAQLISGAVIALGGVVLAVYAITGALPDAPWWLSLVGLFVGALGAALVFTAQNRTVTLAHSVASSVHSKRLIGGKVEDTEFQLSNVAAVYLHTERRMARSNSSSNSRSPRTELVSDLTLVLNTNDQIEIAHRKRGGGGFSVNGMNVGGALRRAPLSKEAQEIATFIGVPLQSNTLGSPLDAVQGIVGAVTGRQQSPPQQTPGQPIQQLHSPQSAAGQSVQPQQPNTSQQPTPEPVQSAAPQQQPQQGAVVTPTQQPEEPNTNRQT